MSVEVNELIEVVSSQGVPFKVTSTTGGKHAAGSYHYRGLAVDLAGPRPSWNSPALLAIFNAFVGVESQLYELIYSGAPYSIKNGVRVSRYAVWSHYNHVHVACRPGFRYNAPPTKVTPMWNPPLSVVASLDAPERGVWLLAPDGAIYAFAGAQYRGGANGQPYFEGRRAARLEANGEGYVIVAESGERYAY